MQIEINSDIGASKKYMQKLLSQYSSDARMHNPGDAATWIEVLLHFMLTISAVPSERKVKLSSTELDIVVPSTKLLQSDPESSLVIQILGAETEQYLDKIRQVQPFAENIWVTSQRLIKGEYRNYALDEEPSIADIIVDITAFLNDKGIKGLRLLH